jgi:hypothetical protein
MACGPCRRQGGARVKRDPARINVGKPRRQYVLNGGPHAAECHFCKDVVGNPMHARDPQTGARIKVCRKPACKKRLERSKPNG